MKRVFVFLIFFIFSVSVFAQTPSPVPEPAKKGGVPTWAKDLRRAEIISLGSLPFVTIWTTLAYSAITKGKIVNPIKSDSDNGFDSKDQVKVLAIACSVSLALGLTDFVINLATRAVDREKQRRELETDRTLVVVPLSEAEPLIEKIPAKPDYLKGGLESAVF